MIEYPYHVGELQWILFPYYGLTNCVAAWRAYQLNEVNLIVRIWMVVGLIGGAHGHLMDFIQVLKGDNRLYFDVIKATKLQHVMGMVLLAFPSLLGIYAMVYLYIVNVSGWSSESWVLFILVCLTLGWDLYYTMGWGTSFQWHKNHVLAHCVFLISEYTSTGYLASKDESSFTFFGIQLVVALGLELLLFFPHLMFYNKSFKSKESNVLNKAMQIKPSNMDTKNVVSGIFGFVMIFATAIAVDFFIKRHHPKAYIPTS